MPDVNLMPLRFSSLIEHLRPADLLDIAIVAMLLYVIFIWLRDRASRSLAIVTAAAVLLFLLARWLDLYLTTMLFHYGMVGLVLAMVVIFQHDIRHGFERLTSSRWFRTTSDQESSSQIVDTLAGAVSAMAEQSIGALLVFPGSQPLNRHIRGGVPVDAKISEQLLISIFYPKSPGHDGAVLIERNRIIWLGLHLPLTTQVDKVHDCGTRHAAALGLAECCDAMIVAVSEERGTITIAYDGQMTVVEPAELTDRLRRHLGSSTKSGPSVRGKRWSEWLTKLAAIVVAVMLWFLFAYHTDTIQRTFVVPIEFRNMPAELEIEQPKPTYAQLTLSGSKPAFTLLDPTTLAISLEVENTNQGRVIRWPTKSNLTSIPKELQIENIVPDEIVVSLRPKANGPAATGN